MVRVISLKFRPKLVLPVSAVNAENLLRLSLKNSVNQAPTPALDNFSLVLLLTVSIVSLVRVRLNRSGIAYHLDLL